MLRTHEVSSLLGVSQRQLQWWDERKVLPIRHENRTRQWNEPELRAAALIAELRSQGLSLNKVRTVLSNVGTINWNEPNRYLIIRMRSLSKSGPKHGFTAVVHRALVAEEIASMKSPVIVVSLDAICRKVSN